jgi:hypothetical protein
MILSGNWASSFLEEHLIVEQQGYLAVQSILPFS